MTPITVICMGNPEPKGSTKIVPRSKFPFAVASFRELLSKVAVTSDNTDLKKWQRLVARAATDAMAGARPFTGPVIVEAAFFLAPPLKIPKERGGFPINRGSGDSDKYLRAAFDALSGVAYEDDAQVVDTTARKRYADTPAHARVEITVTPIAIGLEFPESETIHAHRTPDRTRARIAAATSLW